MNESREASNALRCDHRIRVTLKNSLKVVNSKLVLLQAFVSNSSAEVRLDVVRVVGKGKIGVLEHLAPVLLLGPAGGSVAVDHRALLGVCGGRGGAGVAGDGLLGAPVLEVLVAFGLDEGGAGEGCPVGRCELAEVLCLRRDLDELRLDVVVGGIDHKTLLQHVLRLKHAGKSEKRNGLAIVPLAPPLVELDALLGVSQRLVVETLPAVMKKNNNNVMKRYVEVSLLLLLFFYM